MRRTPPHTLPAAISGAVFGAFLLAAGPAAAAEPACAPSVAMALGAWDKGMAAAERFGDKAVAIAREKGRDYLLPLLGLEEKAVTEKPGAADPTRDVASEVEASRSDPARREALCAAITQATREARDTAGAGLDALRRAIEGLHPAQPRPEPGNGPMGSPKDGQIRI